MCLDYVLWIYFLIFFLIIFVLLRNDKEFFYSVIFALVISLSFLIIVKPPSDISYETDNISSIFIYFAIIFISFITIQIYSAITSFNHLNKKTIKCCY